MNFQSGEITDKLGDLEPEEVSFLHDHLGTGWNWINRLPKNNNIRNNPVNHSKNRMFIIPDKNKFFLKFLVEKIKTAREMICVSSYMIQQSDFTDALLEASKNGIQVFILTAQYVDLLNADPDYSEDDDPDKHRKMDRIRSHQILCEQFSGNVLVRCFSGFHAKYCIIDPRSSQSFGIMMTCNATVGPMTGDNIEIAVTLEPKEIKSFFSHFLFGFWEMAEWELLSGTEFDRVQKNPDFKIQQGLITLPVTASKPSLEQKHTTLLEKIDEMIMKSQKKVILSGWSFNSDHKLLKSLESALDRQVKVTIFTKPRKKNTVALERLVEHGADVFGHEKFHAKCIIIDDNYGLIMTANFTRLGLESGFETAVLIDPLDIGSLLEVFHSWEEECHWELKENIQLLEANEKFLIPDDGEDLKEITIEEEKSWHNENPTKKIEDLREFIDYTPDRGDVKKWAESGNRRIKIVKYTEKIKIPRLPPKAEVEKAQSEKNPFTIYKKNKKRYLAVNTWEDVRRASELDDVKNNKKIRIVWGGPKK